MRFTQTYKNKTAIISCALSKSADLIAPFCILTGCVIMLSYILELLLGYGIGTTLGETSVAGRIFYSVANLLEDSLLPVLGGITALVLSGNKALPAGALGGIISAGGYSFFTPQGSINSTSGLFGALFAGIVAGAATKLSKRIIKKLTKREGTESSDIIITIVSLCITVLTMLFVTSVSTLSGLFFSFVPLILLNFQQPVLYIVLGIMLNINPGNTVYVAAFAFSSSMLSIGNESYTAAVTVATLVPAFAVLISLLYSSERYSFSQKLCGFFGLIFAIGGVNISAIPFLIKKPIRSGFCFSFGGAVAAVMSYYSGCRLQSLEGGFLASQNLNNTLLMGFSVLCGSVVSAAADAVLQYLGDRRTEKKSDKNIFDKAAFE